uniref:SWIM-type domain-containing protein n=1 Tax=Magallana gigas TaxID=29159 RepID=A0A8W8I5G8_MAGGI
MYFVHRLAGDKQCSGDVKAIEKGRNLVENRRIQAVSFMFNGNEIFLSGIVGASMKNKVSYTFKLKLDKVTGDILNSHCECPAGRGPHSTCKHVAAVALMLSKFVQDITWTSHVLKTSRSFINHVTVTMPHQ